MLEDDPKEELITFYKDNKKFAELKLGEYKEKEVIDMKCKYLDNLLLCKDKKRIQITFFPDVFLMLKDGIDFTTGLTHKYIEEGLFYFGHKNMEDFFYLPLLNYKKKK